MAMQPIVIRGLSGPAVEGTVWDISEGGSGLERVQTKTAAKRRARNKWAAPGQKIKLITTTGMAEIVRQGDPSKQPSIDDDPLDLGF